MEDDEIWFPESYSFLSGLFNKPFLKLRCVLTLQSLVHLVFLLVGKFVSKFIAHGFHSFGVKTYLARRELLIDGVDIRRNKAVREALA